MTDNPAPANSRKKLIIGSAAAVGIAAIALVVFVLPAEYGKDPTGLGAALGITKLAPTEEENIYLKRGLARSNVLLPLQESATPDETTLKATLAEHNIAQLPGANVRTDRYVVELAPYEGIELKYDMAEGASMIFKWTATAPVHVDMHSHPFEGGAELTESFVIEDSVPSQTAVYVAPFTGIHGWYWQNRNLDGVTVTLETTGQVTAARTFSSGAEQPRPLADEAPANAGAATTAP